MRVADDALRELSWRPVAELGAYECTPLLGLLEGQAWRFVTWTPDRRAYTAEFVPGIAFEIAHHYCDEAAKYAPPNRTVVQLRLQLCDR